MDRLQGFVQRVLKDKLDQMLGNDALSDAAADVFSEQVVRPFIEQLREKIMDSVTPDPPASYAAELARLGIGVDDVTVRALWRASYNAIAAHRRAAAPETDTPPVQLRAVP